MTIRDLVLLQLDRIKRDMADVDGVNAVLELNPDVLILAEALDGAPANQRGELFGMTVLLKDNIGTSDKTHTSAGCLALAEHYAAEDAHIVKRLRADGALILGKANMTELMNFMSLDMPPGYSARGGCVRNPHNSKESPLGSSSGSAAAVAAGFCSAAIGTETSGSIISPSQYCGVVGLKPTTGLVSRTGIVPISTTLDTAGPITANVRDAAKILSVIAGYDPEDPATAVMKDRRVPDYAQALNPDSLKGARIGVGCGIEPSVDYMPHSGNLLQFLRDQGAELVALEPIPLFMQIRDIMNYEFKAAVEHYLATAGRNAWPRTLRDIYNYNLARAEAALRYGQSRLEFALKEASGQMTEPAYLKALDARRTLTESLYSLFDKHRLDAVVEAAGWHTAAPLCGFPAGTVPIGRYYNNVPAGCYIMCRPFEEDKLLSLLFAVEQNINYK